MKALEDKILNEGKVLAGNVLKVDGFLNHRIDVEFLKEIGEEINRLFRDEGVTLILTIEASGIAIATAAADCMGVPVVFAKKNKTSNIDGNVYRAEVASYTHKTVYPIVVSREYISESDRVLIIDDFLANGNALKGLIDIVGQAGAEFAGAAVAIEKVYQNGGNSLRSQGHRIEALAAIDSMSENGIEFC